MNYAVLRRMPQSKDGKILRDEIIVLHNQKLAAPELMRRVLARVEVDGQEREMTFLTNNLKWIPRSVADLYRCRWAHSFTRLFTILRAALWEKYDLLDLLGRYGTAGGNFRHLARPE